MISSTNTVGTTPKDSSTPFLCCVFLSRSFPYVCLTLLCNIQSFHFVNKTFEKNYSSPLHLSLLHRIGLSVR